VCVCVCVCVCVSVCVCVCVCVCIVFILYGYVCACVWLPGIEPRFTFWIERRDTTQPSCTHRHRGCMKTQTHTDTHRHKHKHKHKHTDRHDDLSLFIVKLHRSDGYPKACGMCCVAPGVWLVAWQTIVINCKPDMMTFPIVNQRKGYHPTLLHTQRHVNTHTFTYRQDDHTLFIPKLHWHPVVDGWPVPYVCGV
jgi:hypothetical protein